VRRSKPSVILVRVQILALQKVIFKLTRDLEKITLAFEIKVLEIIIIIKKKF